MEGQQQQGPSAQALPQHVPLRQITYQGLLRSLGSEAEALQKIHVRIQRQLQNLEIEEKLIMQMVQRERSHHSPEELAEYDQQQQQQLEEQQQQQQQQQQQVQQHQAQQHQQQHQQAAQQQQQQQPAAPEEAPAQISIQQDVRLEQHVEHPQQAPAAAGDGHAAGNSMEENVEVEEF